MLTSTEFGIVTKTDAQEAIFGIRRLLDPKGKYLQWDKRPGMSPDFHKKLQDAGLANFYYKLEKLVFDCEKWEEIANEWMGN